jgi:hypothetical protein
MFFLVKNSHLECSGWITQCRRTVVFAYAFRFIPDRSPKLGTRREGVGSRILKITVREGQNAVGKRQILYRLY